MRRRQRQFQVERLEQRLALSGAADNIGIGDNHGAVHQCGINIFDPTVEIHIHITGNGKHVMEDDQCPPGQAKRGIGPV